MTKCGNELIFSNDMEIILTASGTVKDFGTAYHCNVLFILKWSENVLDAL